MGDLVLKGATSGQITITPTGVAGTNTLTLPAKTGNIITSADSGTVTQTMLASNVAGNGPAFGAYANAATSISNGTFAKILFQVEEFDTNSNFASSRFTPTVAGYYQINSCVMIAAGAGAYSYPVIYLNGTTYFKYGNYAASDGTNTWGVVSSVVYMNGSTDYIEIYATHTAGSAKNTTPGQAFTYFNGSLVRAA